MVECKLDHRVSDIIKSKILEFNLEDIHFKIKHNKNIDEFSDGIISLIDQLEQFNKDIYDLA